MSYNQLHFTSEEEKKLINLIKEHPLLYSVHRKALYKRDIETKDNIWEKIAKHLNKPVSQCKGKWKHIRDYYQRQKRQNKNRYGSRRKNTFKNLQFLEASFKQGTTNSNCTELDEPTNKLQYVETLDTSIDEIQPKIEVQYDYESQPDLANNSENTEQPDVYQEHYEQNNLEDYESDSQEQIKSEDPLQKETSHKNVTAFNETQEAILYEIQKGRKEKMDFFREFFSKQNVSQISTDPTDMFFQSMSAIVKTFPPELVTETRMKVCNIIGILELKALECQQQTSMHSSTVNLTTRASSTADLLENNSNFQSPDSVEN